MFVVVLVACVGCNQHSTPRVEVLRNTIVQDSLVLNNRTGEKYRGFPHDRILAVVDSLLPYHETGKGAVVDPDYTIKVFASGDWAVIPLKIAGGSIEFSFDGHLFNGGTSSQVLEKISLLESRGAKGESLPVAEGG